MAGAGAGVIGAGMGMMAQKAGEMGGIRAMQREEQSEKRMADYLYGLSMRKWEDTGVGAQAEQLRKHGMSVGLMYGNGGAGGQSSAVDTASRKVESGNQMGAMGMQLGAQIGSQLELTKAQTENVQAQTEKVKEETIATGTENKYKNEGVFEDGLTGNQVRYQQEMANMYQSVSQREKIELEIKQMPTELANKTKEMVIKQGELENNIRNANTNEKKVELENKIQEQRNEIEKFKAELEAERPSQDKVVGGMLSEMKADLDRLTGQKKNREEKRRTVNWKS